MADAIGMRLPKDTTIDFAGGMNNPPRIAIRMTVLTKAHIQALRETCDILDRLMEIGEQEPESGEQHGPTKL